MSKCICGALIFDVIHFVNSKGTNIYLSLAGAPWRLKGFRLWIVPYPRGFVASLSEGHILCYEVCYGLLFVYVFDMCSLVWIFFTRLTSERANEWEHLRLWPPNIARSEVHEKRSKTWWNSRCRCAASLRRGNRNLKNDWQKVGTSSCRDACWWRGPLSKDTPIGLIQSQSHSHNLSMTNESFWRRIIGNEWITEMNSSLEATHCVGNPPNKLPHHRTAQLPKRWSFVRS